MLSRVADAVYWCSRYVERAENVARFVNVNLDLTLESPTAQGPSWQPLVETAGDSEWFREHYGEATQHSVLEFLTFDPEYPNSILASVRRARENAQTVREIISREMWQAINELYLFVKEAKRTPRDQLHLGEFYDAIKFAGIRFTGVTDATLSRGDAWHFARMGALIERADKTSRILDVKYYILLPTGGEVGGPFDLIGWTALLNSASALQMYRQKYHVIGPKQVAEFLVLDTEFPRSLAYCITRANESLARVNGEVGKFRAKSESVRHMGKLESSLVYGDIEQVMEVGLHEYLDTFQTQLNDVGVAVAKQFFWLRDD